MIPDEHVRVADRLLALLTAIEDAEIRARVAARELDRLEVEAAASALAVLVRRTAERSPRAGVAVGALGRALAEVAEERREAIREAAIAAGLKEIAAFLASAVPLRAVTPADLKDPPGLEGISLGHRKVMARGHSPDQLARLARSGQPEVIASLLQNPRVTEPDVVRLAAQRPIRADALEAIARSRRFGFLPAVRRAIVKNPYAPVELALRLAPLLLAPELRDVGADGSLHPAVRDEALRVLAARGDRLGLAARSRLDQLEAAEERRRLAEEQLRAEESENADEFEALCEALEAGALPLRRVDDD